MDERRLIYETKQADVSLKLVAVVRNLRLLSLLRFLAFAATLVLPFVLYPLNHLSGIVCPIITFTLFLFGVKQFQIKEKQKIFLHNLLKINQNEIDALGHQFSQFDSCSEFIDPNHHYTYDLDIFGKGSLFQFLNRTVLQSGKVRLAEMLSVPMLDIVQIHENQLFIDELSAKLDWRQKFAALGTTETENASQHVFKMTATIQIGLNKVSWLPTVIVILVSISIIGLVVWIISGNSALFILVCTAQALLWGWQYKAIKKTYTLFGQQANQLSQFSLMLVEIENESWTSVRGKQLVEALKQHGLPSYEIQQLRSIITAFDNRNNVFVGFILNMMFCWDVWCTWRLYRWHLRNRNNYALWDDTLAQFDASNSLANFAFNHPCNNFPIAEESTFFIQATALAHPLIHPDKRKDNLFHIEGEPTVMIVTGANMSGKSTFLRTVGVNMVLAMAGAPVCAQDMRFTPVDLFSNMRTTDSLFDDESYFFAELKRLQAILKEIEQGKRVLVILDEILKGTNSVDKLYGSQQLVRKLVRHQATVIVATHDLKLTELDQEFSGIVHNQCFEIEIQNDEMHFDYQLRNGITHVMNATFLMKKMGIVD